MSLNEQGRSLIKATVISFVIAIITLVFFVLPAEYNIDPTGIGAKLGLTVFNQEESSAPAVSENSDGEMDVVTVTVPAGRGVEYKLAMEQFQKVTYQWETEEGELYFDLHGEPKGDTTGYFESYTIATSDKVKGSFTVPFTGSHGWYWRNKSDKDINVQLIIEGEYIIQGLKK